jgi:hypothetical protein
MRSAYTYPSNIIRLSAGILLRGAALPLPCAARGLGLGGVVGGAVGAVGGAAGSAAGGVGGITSGLGGVAGGISSGLGSTTSGISDSEGGISTGLKSGENGFGGGSSFFSGSHFFSGGADIGGTRISPNAPYYSTSSGSAQSSTGPQLRTALQAIARRRCTTTTATNS